jgi:mannosyltransferase
MASAVASPIEESGVLPAALARPREDARRELLVVASITLLAAALRFATLHIQSFDDDEAITISLLHRGLGGMLHRIPVSEQTPPLYYVLAWFWARLFGFGEVGVRSLSALAGTLTVPLSYLAARTLGGRRTALATAALVAFNPFLLWYSQEARSYALFAALSAAALWMFLCALQRPRSRELWWWAVLSALALVTHYFAIFLIVPQAAWLIGAASPGPRSAAIKASVLPAAAALALAPLALAQRSPGKYPFTKLESLGTRTAQIPEQMLVGLGLPAQVAWLLPVIALSLLAGWLLVRNLSVDRRPVLALGSIAVVGLVAPLVVALGGIDVVLSRNFIAILVPCLVLAGAGFAATRAGLVACAALCAIWLGAFVVVESQPAWQRPSWRAIASALGPAHGSRLVLAMPASLGADPLPLYLSGTKFVAERDVLHLNEFDIVGIFSPGSSGARTIERLAPPAPGFQLVRERITSAYVIVEFRRSKPVLDSLAHPVLLRSDNGARVPMSGPLCCASLVQNSSGAGS